MFSAQPSGMYPFADRSAPDQDPAAAPVPAAAGVKESAQTPEQSPQAERIPTADSDRPETISVPLDAAAALYLSGMNGALGRTPRVETRSVKLLDKPTPAPAWKPSRIRVQTFGLTFPAGVEFLPPKPEKPESDGSQAEQPEALESILPPAPVPAPEDEAAPKARKRTRVRPPRDALSVEDRLFYLLQPPLESWLAGQELIMPFEPFPYQYEGIAWMFSQRSALLADEMGLGKTMQTITAIRLLLRAGQVRRVLLCCPKPLIPNWQREFALWAEEVPVTTVEGDSNRRRMIWTMPGIPVLLTNYESMVRDFESLPEDQRPQFDLVVLDEAQRVKNRESLTAKVARGLSRRRSWALTGTPIENRPEEMASLFEFIEIIPPRGTPDLRQLSALSRDFVLRRTKDLVMKDLPARLDRDEILQLNPAQELAYRTAEKEGVIQLDDMGESITIQHVFELVLRLKQITNYDPLTGESAKLDRLVADMEEISASGGKAILFSQWTRSIDWLKEQLDRRLTNCGTLIYHGGVPTKKREPILTQFKEDPDSNLLMMSYGTGAVGLNLQFAGYVFLFDRWWNPAVEDQAINRAHRIGQKSKVIVTRFISKDTIEERIDLVLRQKRELFERILGSGDSEGGSLSLNASEIFGLFDLKARAGGGTKSIGPKTPEGEGKSGSKAA